MGNTSTALPQGNEFEANTEGREICFPQNSPHKDWDVVFRGSQSDWNSVSGKLGLDDYQVECRLGAELCDRDYVCSGYHCVMYRRWKRVLYITRFKKKPLTIPVGSHLDMHQLLASATARRLLVVALAQDLAVFETMVGERKHAFPIVDLANRCVRAVYKPTFLLTVIEGEITPDLTHTGLLLYCQSPESLIFTYSLLLISNKTGELVKRVCLSLGEGQPHFAFHPAYRSPHIAVSQYRAGENNNKLVILKLSDETVKSSASPHLSFIMGTRQLFTKFSPDGRFLLLQKLSDDRFGVTSFCDTYIFNVTENTFHLVKYISSKIPGVFFSCRVSFKPEFSRCGRYMRILNTYTDSVDVMVLAVPNCLDLMARCRQIIIGSMQSSRLVSELPIPNRLKDYLLFKPTLDG